MSSCDFDACLRVRKFFKLSVSKELILTAGLGHVAQSVGHLTR